MGLIAITRQVRGRGTLTASASAECSRDGALVKKRVRCVTSLVTNRHYAQNPLKTCNGLIASVDESLSGLGQGWTPTTAYIRRLLLTTLIGPKINEKYVGIFG